MYFKEEKEVKKENKKTFYHFIKIQPLVESTLVRWSTKNLKTDV